MYGIARLCDSTIDWIITGVGENVSPLRKEDDPSVMVAAARHDVEMLKGWVEDERRKRELDQVRHDAQMKRMQDEIRKIRRALTQKEKK